MTTKVINMVIEGTCENCPFCQYDPDYNRSYDSGWDCEYPGEMESRRIADDGDISRYDERKREAKRLPLFAEEFTEPHPLTIPEWCPLEDKK